MTHPTPPKYNPRWVLWLRTQGETPETFKVRTTPDAEITQIDGLPWTIVYSEWIRARWREWAATIGFKHGCVSTQLPWERALAAGHTQEDFDHWLEERVNAQ